MAFVDDRGRQGPCIHRVLRYVHDSSAGEFIDVVVAACDVPCVAARFKTDCGRVKGALASLESRLHDKSIVFRRRSRLCQPPCRTE